MTDREVAAVKAIVKIAELFSTEYVRDHYKQACESISERIGDEIRYFIGFEGNDEINKWTVFAHVSVDMNSFKVSFLDYKLPSGFRMTKPIIPVRYA